MFEIPKPVPYTRQDYALPPLVFVVAIYNPHSGAFSEVTFACRHVRIDEYMSLNDATPLELDLKAGSGQRELVVRRAKLKAVVESMEGCGDLAGDPKAYLDLRGNENLVMMAWSKYEEALNRPDLFRPAEDSSQAAGVSSAGDEEDSAVARA